MCNEYLGLTWNSAKKEKKKEKREEKRREGKKRKEERDGDSSQASI